MGQSFKECELLEQCGFFVNYSSNIEVVKQGWARLFCENKNNKSEACARKKQFLESGEKPPDNLAPNGILMPINT